MGSSPLLRPHISPPTRAPSFQQRLQLQESVSDPGPTGKLLPPPSSGRAELGVGGWVSVPCWGYARGPMGVVAPQSWTQAWLRTTSGWRSWWSGWRAARGEASSGPRGSPQLRAPGRLGFPVLTCRPPSPQAEAAAPGSPPAPGPGRAAAAGAPVPGSHVRPHRRHLLRGEGWEWGGQGWWAPRARLTRVSVPRRRPSRTSCATEGPGCQDDPTIKGYRGLPPAWRLGCAWGPAVWGLWRVVGLGAKAGGQG